MQGVANGVLDAHEKLLIDQAIAAHEGHAGALLGILETVQSANATFYALFNLDPQGDNVVCVCRGTACHTRGSRDLLEKLCLDLGLSEHEQGDANDADKLALTTADRKFTVRTVACFGQCALAPVVEVNHHILSHVNERTLQREVKALTKGGK